MTNKARQHSLEKKYGRKGDQPYCKFCGECKGGKCTHNFDPWRTSKDGLRYLCSPGEPCATAYNRMVRKQQKEGKR